MKEETTKDGKREENERGIKESGKRREADRVKYEEKKKGRRKVALK